MKLEERLLDVLRETIIDMVRADRPDLTARQFAVLLICCLEHDVPQTVRELAGRLNVSKPAITRALDRLEEFDLVKRADDPRDRRSVLAVATPTGFGFVDEVGTVMHRSARRAPVKPVGLVASRKAEPVHLV